jgi:hypothetical protein
VSNTYSDATGVLLFDGPATITPVIRMLFASFKLDETPEDSGNEHYVAVLAEDNHYDWDTYIDDVMEAAEREFDIDFEGRTTPVEALKAVAAHFNADLGDWLSAVDFDNSVLLSDLVALALLLRDGHNLVGLSLEGCWHCDKPRLWEFGGWSTYASARYILAVSTADISVFARAVDTCLVRGAPATASIVKTFLQELLDGIADPRLRKDVGTHLADLLREPPAAGDGPETADVPPPWTRVVYVEAYATDEGSGPGYARVDVTPQFIGRLKSLRALCKERNLTEVRVTDAPDAWGPGTSEEDLRLQAPELVVTPRMFWFTDRPKGLPIEIRTRGYDIERFIYEVSGAGEPVYLGVEPEDIDDDPPSAS